MFRFEDISFAAFLWLLPLVLVLFAYATHRRKKTLENFGHPESLHLLFSGYDRQKSMWKKAVIVLGLLGCIAAGTNPQWGYKREEVESKGTDLVLIVDISNSMLCEDVAPNRLERTKRFSLDLLSRLRSHRVGLVFFAGSAFIQSPVTTDHAVLSIMIKSAHPDMTSDQGTNLSLALQKAAELLKPDEGRHGAVLVITDGEDHDEHALSEARRLKEEGISVYTVGIGTETGGPIVVEDRGQKYHKRDENGEIVISRLNPSLINELADSGGGQAYLATQGIEAIKGLLSDLDALQKTRTQINSFTEFRSYYQYLLFPAVCLLFFGIFLSDDKMRKS